MRKYLILFLSSLVTSLSGQTLEEKAIVNFESYSTSTKNTFPAEKNKNSFKNYSDLWARKSIPDELKMMMDYDTLKFYSLYLNHIKSSRDTLIKINELDFSQNIKDIYIIFKSSILVGQKLHKFNYKKDKEYSDSLIRIINQVEPPQIGYYQTATAVSFLPNGQTTETKIIITYTNDLEPIEYSIVE